jgi:endonuclease/exonuclease/phosphatase family metal-dependent hydrolase
VLTRIYIIALLLALPLMADAEPFELNVMSFNIRYGTANDGENSWGNRKDVVVDMLREHSPDIVGMQECLDFQADYLVEQIPQYKWFGVGREADASGERMAILYKCKWFSPIEVKNFWLSETPEIPGSRSWDTACPRMVTAARFFHNRTRQFFVFCNTHFDHRSEAARQGAAEVLRDYIGLLDEPMPVIVTGDFNSKAGDSVAWNTLVQGDVRDAWLTAEKTAGPAITFGGYEPPKPNIDRRIDWILVRGPITVEHCETVTYEENGHYPSDHYPVAARLRVGP